MSKENDMVDVHIWSRELRLKEIRILYILGLAEEIGEVSKRVVYLIIHQFAGE